MVAVMRIRNGRGTLKFDWKRARLKNVESSTSTPQSDALKCLKRLRFIAFFFNQFQFVCVCVPCVLQTASIYFLLSVNLQERCVTNLNAYFELGAFHCTIR